MMVTNPTVHGRTTTVRELRAFFRNDHVHMALLVDRGTLIGTVERNDLARADSDATAATAIATLDGRTIHPEADLSGAFGAMKRADRRRLAVTADDSKLLGLLCLKASRLGFCADADVASRRFAEYGEPELA